MEKKFNVAMPEEMHKTLKVKAAVKGMTMNDYIVEAVEAKLKADGMTGRKRMAEAK